MKHNKWICLQENWAATTIKTHDNWAATKWQTDWQRVNMHLHTDEHAAERSHMP